jgi:CRP-like cAMP-binding protein
MQSKEYEMLRHSRLFKYIDEPQFKQIMHCMQPKLQKYEKGETIISDGDAFLYYYVLIHGSASVYKFEYSGERVLIKRVSPGGIIGMIPAFYNNSTRRLCCHVIKFCTYSIMQMQLSVQGISGVYK